MQAPLCICIPCLSDLCWYSLPGECDVEPYVLLQITLIILWESGVNVSRHVGTVYQIIRLLRLIRFASLMKRLYASATAAGTAISSTSSFNPQYANFATLIYAGLAVLSFLSCLMYAAGQCLMSARMCMILMMS